MGCVSSKEAAKSIEEVAEKNLQKTIVVPMEYRKSGVGSRPPSRPNSRPGSRAGSQPNSRLGSRAGSPTANRVKGVTTNDIDVKIVEANGQKAVPSRDISKRSVDSGAEGYHTANEKLPDSASNDGDDTSVKAGVPGRTPKAFPVDVPDYSFVDEDDSHHRGAASSKPNSKKEMTTPTPISQLKQPHFAEGLSPNTVSQLASAQKAVAAAAASEAAAQQAKQKADELEAGKSPVPEKKRSRRGMLVAPRSVKQKEGNTDVSCTCGHRFVVKLELWRTTGGKVPCGGCEALVQVPMMLPPEEEKKKEVRASASGKSYAESIAQAVAHLERPPSVQSMVSAKNIRQDKGLTKVICPCLHNFNVKEKEWKKVNGRVPCPACKTILSVPMRFADGTLSAPSFTNATKPKETLPTRIYQVEGLTEVTCSCGDLFIIRYPEWKTKGGKATCPGCLAVMPVPMQVPEPDEEPEIVPAQPPVKSGSKQELVPGKTSSKGQLGADPEDPNHHKDVDPQADADLVSPREIVQSDRWSRVACLCNAVLNVTLDSWNKDRGKIPCANCGLLLKVPLRKVGKLQEWRYKAVELGMKIPENEAASKTGEADPSAAAAQGRLPYHRGRAGQTSPGKNSEAGSQVGPLPFQPVNQYQPMPGMMGMPGMLPGGFIPAMMDPYAQQSADTMSLRGASRRNQMYTGATASGSLYRAGASEAGGKMTLEAQAASRRNLLQQSMELQAMQQQAMMNNMALGLNPMTGLVNPMMMGPMGMNPMMNPIGMMNPMMNPMMMQQQQMMMQQQQQMMSPSASARNLNLKSSNSGGNLTASPSMRRITNASIVSQSPPPSVTNVSEYFAPGQTAPKKMFITDNATHLLCNCNNMLFVTVDSWQETGGVIACPKCRTEYNLPLRAVGKLTSDAIGGDGASVAGSARAPLRKTATMGGPPPYMMLQHQGSIPGTGTGTGVTPSSSGGKGGMTPSPQATRSPIQAAPSRGQLVRANTLSQQGQKTDTEVVKATAAYLGLQQRRAKPKKVFMYDTAINVVCGCGQTNLATYEEVRNNNFGVECSKCACMLDIDIPPEKLKEKKPNIIKAASMLISKDKGIKYEIDSGVVEPVRIKQGDKNTKVWCICSTAFTVDLRSWLALPVEEKNKFPCPKCKVRVHVPVRNIGYIPQWRLHALEEELPVEYGDLDEKIRSSQNGASPAPKA